MYELTEAVVLHASVWELLNHCTSRLLPVSTSTLVLNMSVQTGHICVE
jgi:hypothetical protein